MSCGQSGCRNCCDNGGSTQSFLKWSGIIPTLPTTVYLADGGVGASATAAPNAYPVPESFLGRTLSVNVQGPGGELAVNLLKNGAVVATINYGGANPLNGVQRLAIPNSGVQYTRIDTYDLQVVTTSLTPVTTISATLAVRS